jgi:hypothetical protein
VFHGRFVEVQVAMLREVVPSSGVAPWDLLTRFGHRLEVRTAGPGRAFSRIGSKQVDAWVFASGDDTSGSPRCPAGPCVGR